MLEWRYPDKPQSATSEFLSFIKEDEWYSTSKLDGWRMNVYTDKDKNAQLFTRVGNLIQNATKVPLPLVKAVSKLCSYRS